MVQGPVLRSVTGPQPVQPLLDTEQSLSFLWNVLLFDHGWLTTEVEQKRLRRCLGKLVSSSRSTRVTTFLRYLGQCIYF